MKLKKCGAVFVFILFASAAVIRAPKSVSGKILNDFFALKADAEMQVQSVSMSSSSDGAPAGNSAVYNSSQSSVTQVKVYPPIALSYKTKSYVYAVREMYVEASIFASPDYKPSEAVFGQIVDNKPWISSGYIFSNTNPVRTDGTAEESRFINNPSLLVALVENGANYNPDKASILASDPDVQYIPRQILYDKSKKEITAVYNLPAYDSFYRIESIELNGLNARDFGYKYVFVDKNKSTLSMTFTSANNVSNQVTEFRNYIHLGGSCGVEGGCNNGSPDQPMLQFKPNFNVTSKGGTIYLKLWKNKPSSPYNKPDMVEIIKLIRN